MSAIFVRGFWGGATTLDPQIVARAGVNAALRGKAVCIPGWANKLVNFLRLLVPVSLKVRFVANRWNVTQSNIAQQDFLAGRLITTRSQG